MQTKEQYIAEGFGEKFRVWFGKVCLLTVGYYLVSSALDLIRQPETFLYMLAHRLPAMAALLVAALVVKKWHGRGITFHYAVAFAAILLCAAEAERRVFLTGGAASPFFVEFIMLGVLFVGYVPGSLRFWTPLAVAVCFVYAGPLVLHAAPGEAREIAFKTAYIVIGYIVLLYMRHLRNLAVLRQLALRYEIIQKGGLPEEA